MAERLRLLKFITSVSFLIWCFAVTKVQITKNLLIFFKNVDLISFTHKKSCYL